MKCFYFVLDITFVNYFSCMLQVITLLKDPSSNFKCCIEANKLTFKILCYIWKIHVSFSHVSAPHPPLLLLLKEIPPPTMIIPPVHYCGSWRFFYCHRHIHLCFIHDELNCSQNVQLSFCPTKEHSSKNYLASQNANDQMSSMSPGAFFNTDVFHGVQNFKLSWEIHYW